MKMIWKRCLETKNNLKDFFVIKRGVMGSCKYLQMPLLSLKGEKEKP